MDYAIRDIRRDEYPLLEEFLYQAIYVPEGFEGAIPRSVIRDDPKCRAAYEGFGTLPDDRALVAEAGGEVVGACWARTTDEYGHVDEKTPSLSISLFEDYRGHGIGTALMRCMIDELQKAGYGRTSLSVQKENPALRLYERLGFRIVGNGADATEWLMIRELNEPFPIIETERLVLRPWLASDAESLYALASDPEMGPLAGWPSHASVEDSAKIIATVFAAHETYAVVLKETGELVGCAGFNADEAANMPLGSDELELGYWIGRPYWRRGYATEAARAAIERGFCNLELNAIHAAYFDGNNRSHRVLDKLGFSYVRTETDVECKLLGERRTEHFMCLARDAWQRLADNPNLPQANPITRRPAVNEHDLKAVEAFFSQVDENGVPNAEKAEKLHHTIRRVQSTPKDRSFEDAGEDGRAGGLPVGVVEVDGKFIGLGIHILNEDVYPLQSFEIYLRGCDLVGHLDLSGCTDVVFVDLYRNRLSSVDVADMPALRILGLQDNQIEALDPTGLPACQGIDAGFNCLASIDVSRNLELVELYVNDNRIASLDTSCNPKLKYLRCQNNRLREVDTTANPLLRHLYATGNPCKLIRALAPGSDGTLPLELSASEGGCVGLSFNPIYNAQWKETGEWEQSYHAYVDEGFAFAGWFDETGACVSQEQDWNDEYGQSRQLVARFEKA